MMNQKPSRLEKIRKVLVYTPYLEPKNPVMKAKHEKIDNLNFTDVAKKCRQIFEISLKRGKNKYERENNL